MYVFRSTAVYRYFPSVSWSSEAGRGSVSYTVSGVAPARVLQPLKASFGANPLTSAWAQALEPILVTGKCALY